MLTIDEVVMEIESERPVVAPPLLSRNEKERLIQRGFHALYRWYVDRSQAARGWNPDRSFQWREIGRKHSEELITIIEGFYAIEQYAPDYTSELVRMARKNYGRAQFQLRWGAEEEKHSDLWRNSLLFSRARTQTEVEQYTSDLRRNAWTLPFDQPIHMLLYTVIQERATQLNYLNFNHIVSGNSDKPQFAGDADPVLTEASATIARDEAAHFHFFLEGARLYLYYFPEETLAALVDVLRNFMMPAHDLVINYAKFVKTIYDGGVFDRRKHARDVIQVALKALGIGSLSAIEKGIARKREAPVPEGRTRGTALFSGVNFSIVEAAVERLFARIGHYENEIGLIDVAPTIFVRNAWT